MIILNKILILNIHEIQHPRKLTPTEIQKYSLFKITRNFNSLKITTHTVAMHVLHVSFAKFNLTRETHFKHLIIYVRYIAVKVVTNMKNKYSWSTM